MILKRLIIACLIILTFLIFSVFPYKNKIVMGKEMKAMKDLTLTTTEPGINTTQQSVNLENTSPSLDSKVIKSMVKPQNSIGFNTSTIKYPEAKNTIVNATIQKYSYEFMFHDIERLSKKYPNSLKMSFIGKSVLNRSIPVLILGKSEYKNKVLIVGSVHGREYITTLLIMKQLEEYLKNYNNKINGMDLKKLLSNTCLYFIPMLNPDGVALSQFGLSSVNIEDKKTALLLMNANNANFEGWKANANGVDLNRNFSCGWKAFPEKAPSPEKSKGPSPESEPETRAITNYIRKINFNGIICYHVTGSVIYWYNDQDKKTLNRDLNIAKEISKITKYPLVKPQKNSQEGGLKDWFIPTFHKPGLTIEVGKSKTCPLPASEFPHIWAENKIVPLAFAQRIGKQ